MILNIYVEPFCWNVRSFDDHVPLTMIPWLILNKISIEAQLKNYTLFR